MVFLRGLWRFLVGVKDALVLVFMLLFFVALWAALSARAPLSVPDGGALVLDMSGTVVDQTAQRPALELLSGGLPLDNETADVVRAIRAAQSDVRIKALVLQMDGFVGGGLANMQAIGRALDDFRKSGKPVYAYATAYFDDGYLLAAHADEVWVNPLGGVYLTGPGGSGLYFSEALSRLGVTVNVFRVGTFKSAVEPYTRQDASPEARAADQALVDALWRTYNADVRAARPKANPAAFLANLPDRLRAAGGDMARASTSAGLVDRVGSWSELTAEMRGLVGEDGSNAPGGFNGLDHRSYLSATQGVLPQTGPAVGIVYVSGEIVDGEGLPGTAAGDTIAGLIEEALTDGSIKALVMRVDSPGGSVTASERIRQAALTARDRGVPVVTSFGPVAASGGYWVGASGQTIFAEPSTITGSIGVFAIVPSFEQTLRDIGVGADGVKSTPYSGEPDVLRGLGPETQVVLQTSVEDIYRRFIALVAQSRRLPTARVDQIGQGRVWDGTTARELGLVDRMGGLEAAVAEARRLANLPADTRTVDVELKPLLPYEVLAGFAGVRETPAARDPVAKAALRQRARVLGAGASALRAVSQPSIKALCASCIGLGAPTLPSPGAEAELARLAGAIAR